ncbi:MAG: adenylate/guanylate cyclase domain-containing protein [Acidimicrobiales bacterium]
MTVVTSTLEMVSGTVVFTDLVGFTEFNAVRGDADAVQLLAKQEQLVAAALPSDARLVKELGDGLLLWFPDATSALCTALDLLPRFDAHSDATGLPPWVRIGLHWGRQTIRGDDLVGHDVNVAARIVDVAGSGEVLLSQATRTAIDASLPDVSFEELGPVVMKGLPEPVPLFRAWR